MRLQTSQNIDYLIELVNEVITAMPHERGGTQFAALPLDVWAAKLGWCEKTVGNYFDRPQFHCEMAAIDGVRIKLVRVRAPGEPATMTAPAMANQMRRAWANRAIDHEAMAKAEAAGKPWKIAGSIEGGKPVMSKQAHRALVRLATVWPAGLQLVIFKGVLANWAGFAVLAKIAMTLEQDRKTGDADLPVKGLRFLKFPTLELMLRYPGAAVELYEDTEQANNPKPSMLGHGLSW